MTNIDQELDKILQTAKAVIIEPDNGSWHYVTVIEQDKRALKALITTRKQELLSEIEKELEPKLRELYYHDPDELGEDAFNNLGDDEVEEVLAIITTKREEI